MNPLASLDLGFGRRLPMVFQTEAAECGLACLAMVPVLLGLWAYARVAGEGLAFTLSSYSLKGALKSLADLAAKK